MKNNFSPFERACQAREISGLAFFIPFISAQFLVVVLSLDENSGIHPSDAYVDS